MQRRSRLQRTVVRSERNCRMMRNSYPSSVTNASAKSSRSDIPVFAGRSIPKKVLNPLEKFPLSKRKAARCSWPRPKRENAIIPVEKPPELTGKILFSSGDYSISPTHLRDRQRRRTAKRQRSRVCARVRFSRGARSSCRKPGARPLRQSQRHGARISGRHTRDFPRSAAARALIIEALAHRAVSPPSITNSAPVTKLD